MKSRSTAGATYGYRTALVCVVILAAATVANNAAAGDPPPKGWAKTESALKAAVLQKNFDAAVGYVTDLARTNDERGAEAIIKYAMGGKDWGLDRHAGGSVAGMTDPKVRKFVYDTVAKGKQLTSTVILLAVCARWSKDDPKALDAIHAALKNRRHKSVVFAALRWIRELKRPDDSVEPLIDALAIYERKSRGRVYWDLRHALEDLTGQDFQIADLWRDYWKAHKEGRAPKKRKEPKGKRRTALYKPPSFFSVSVDSDRVLFIIDISHSMTIPDTVIKEPDRGSSKKKGRTSVGGPGGTAAPTQENVMRITRVQKELIQTLRGLPAHVRFGILSFNHEMAYYGSAGLLTYASQDEIERAVSWVGALKPNGATRTDTALLESFKFGDIDTICLLTDGAPKTVKNEKIPPARVLGIAKYQNRFRKCRIHTIGFAQAGQTMKQLCLDLARQNDGKCVLLD